MRTLTIAAVQTKPVSQDVEATLAQFEQQVQSVHALFPHVQLVIVPELLLAAEGPLLGPPGPSIRDLAHRLPGPLTQRLGELARSTGLWLVPGTVYELGDDDRVYNTAIVISPEGKVAGQYRKVFPWQPHEESTPGCECVVVDLPDIGRIGLAICYDGSFPEIARQLAWLGAEVIVQPTLTTTRDRDMELVCARANAWTNQVFLVNVNACDPAGVGQSLIVDPEGMVRQQAGPGEEVLIDVLDLDSVWRIRRDGSQGISTLWKQLAEHGPNLKFPMYPGGIQPPPWSTKPEKP
jgi:formamidase